LRLHPDAAANLAVAQVPTFNQALSAADARAQLRTAKFGPWQALKLTRSTSPTWRINTKSRQSL
jgi:hypothetical protein